MSSQVTVTGTIYSAPGVLLAKGYAVWQLSGDLLSKAGTIVHSATHLAFPINNGAMSAVVWPNNDPTLTPTTTFYTVTIYSQGTNGTLTPIDTAGYTVPYNVTTVDISALPTVTLPGQNPTGINLPPLKGNASTQGFLGLPTVAGAPTGTPVEGAGCACFDTTNNKIWIWNGSWKGVVVA